jgi:glycosyltransferase involved in cell wall biosynthesis
MRYRSERAVSADGTTWAAIAWAPYSRRSEMFARELGGELHCVHYLKYRSPPYAPLKYVLQALRTLHILFRDRPTAVHAQDPPFFCGFVVSLYCRVTGAAFVVEYHTAAFGWAWRWAVPLQKYVARRAAANIVTNEHWSELVRSWGGHTLVMYDAFLDLGTGKPYPVTQHPNVAFVTVFAPDEPVDAVLEAAARLPDVHFFVTGDPKMAPPTLLARATSNVTFTGFLDPGGEYIGLLRAADAVIVLTTRDHTLQLAGCEAIALGKPLVTSDWPYLRELFEDAAVYVDADADSIRAGVEAVIERREELAHETQRLTDVRRAQWRARLAELNRLVEGGAPPVVGVGAPQRART